MRKLPAPLLLAGLLATSIAAHAQTPGPAAAAPEPAPSPFTGKLGLYSEYEYRGISQTSEKPALQLNLDYAHNSGLYVGTFLSNIKWLKDTADVNGFSTGARVEWDIYGGYKHAFGDVTMDVGYLRYEYPSSSAFDRPGFVSPNTDEVYIGASWGPATLKYSYSINDTFGVPNSKGSDYTELTVNYALPQLEKLTVNALVGHRTTATTPSSATRCGSSAPRGTSAPASPRAPTTRAPTPTSSSTPTRAGTGVTTARSRSSPGPSRAAHTGEET